MIYRYMFQGFHKSEDIKVKENNEVKIYLYLYLMMKYLCILNQKTAILIQMILLVKI